MYSFHQRLSYKGKTKSMKIDTLDLTTARKQALENFKNIVQLFQPKVPEVTLTQVMQDYYAYVHQRGLRPNTLRMFDKCYNKYFLPLSKGILLKDITPKLLFELYIKPSLDKGNQDIVLYIQTRLIQAVELARANYIHVSIPDITCMRRLYAMPSKEKHLPCMGIEGIKALSELPCTVPVHALIELSLHLLLRPLEMVSIRYSDVDFEAHILNVPRTKTTTDFKVPLTTQAELIIRFMKLIKTKENDYVFEGARGDHLSREIIGRVLRYKGLSGKQTAHSIRAIGRTWFEENGVKFEVAETILSHKVHDSTYRAYVRTDYLEERREAMQRWSNYISSQFVGSVIEMMF